MNGSDVIPITSARAGSLLKHSRLTVIFKNRQGEERCSWHRFATRTHLDPEPINQNAMA